MKVVGRSLEGAKKIPDVCDDMGIHLPKIFNTGHGRVEFWEVRRVVESLDKTPTQTSFADKQDCIR